MQLKELSGYQCCMQFKMYCFNKLYQESIIVYYGWVLCIHVDLSAMYFYSILHSHCLSIIHLGDDVYFSCNKCIFHG